MASLRPEALSDASLAPSSYTRDTSALLSFSLIRMEMGPRGSRATAWGGEGRLAGEEEDAEAAPEEGTEAESGGGSRREAAGAATEPATACLASAISPVMASNAATCRGGKTKKPSIKQKRG